MRRDTFEALAFGVVIVAVISGTALGFSALADGGVSVGAGSILGGGDDDGGTESGEHSDEHGGDMGDMDGMEMDGGMNMEMRMVDNGTVINGNEAELPPGCDGVRGERSVTVRGGVEYSEGGEMFSFDRDRLELERCTRVAVTFVNEDSIRHQWMLHGLPMETYPMGMFNVEVDGPGSATGTFITPAEDATLNTHCSLPQHEQKGMHMEIVVGDGGDNGDGDH